MIDWINEFIDKFHNDEHINNLKHKKIYGSLKINFKEGEAKSYDLTIHRADLMGGK